MIKKHTYILLSGMVLFNTFMASAQVSVPDNVCTGQVRHYYVNYNKGSTYKWWINGILQDGFTTNEFVHTWNTTDIYLLEVQELSAEGCPGPVRSAYIAVTRSGQPRLIIPEAFSPNGDLINDFWNIGNIDNYTNAEITVYNRWGQSVWRSERGYPVPWDGKSNGIKLPIDSYHYVIDLHNGSKPIVGEITIVR